MSYEELKERLTERKKLKYLSDGCKCGECQLVPIRTIVDAAEAITTLEAERDRLREALEDIAIYGCGMLNQPIAMNGPEEAWLEKRIREYERRARQALGGSHD